MRGRRRRRAKLGLGRLKGERLGARGAECRRVPSDARERERGGAGEAASWPGGRVGAARGIRVQASPTAVSRSSVNTVRQTPNGEREGHARCSLSPTTHLVHSICAIGLRSSTAPARAEPFLLPPLCAGAPPSSSSDESKPAAGSTARGWRRSSVERSTAGPCGVETSEPVAAAVAAGDDVL